MVGTICALPVEIGLTDLPKSGSYRPVSYSYFMAIIQPVPLLTKAVFSSDLSTHYSFFYSTDYGHTSYNSFHKWTKISSLEIIIFELL